jgi:hypothetical protein
MSFLAGLGGGSHVIYKGGEPRSAKLNVDFSFAVFLANWARHPSDYLSADLLHPKSDPVFSTTAEGGDLHGAGKSVDRLGIYSHEPEF